MTGTVLQKQRSHGGLLAGKRRGQNEGKGTGNKKHKLQVQNRQGEVKNNMGNREAKELICMTHGHELMRGRMLVQGYMAEGNTEEIKIWDNCNSIINKIYF